MISICRLSPPVLTTALALLLVAGMALFAAVFGPMAQAAGTDDPMAGAPIFITRDGVTQVVLNVPGMPRYSVDRDADGRVLTIDFRDGIEPPTEFQGGGAGAVRQYQWLAQPDGVWRLALTGQGPLTIATVYAEPLVDVVGHRFVLEVQGPTNRVPHSTNASVAALPIPPVPKPRPTMTTAASTVAPAASASTSVAIPTAKPVLPTIVLDAGHGGMDPGAIAVNGMLEKDVALDVTRLLARKLAATGRYQVRLTRSDDTFIRLRERVSLARDFGADFFMSIHADSHPTDDVRGASVYTLSERASDREAARLANQENREDAVSGVDLGQESDDVASILIDLAMRETVNDSRGVANILVEALQKKNIRILRKTHRFAGFAVLTAADVPSVLVELGYLSNATDARLLASNEYRNRITDALVAGIDDYFASRPQVAIAPE